ncbi:MAG: GntR family transcriptional regulator [Gulosibacter sp.]|uniref:GntR family transcriptional regulator n=1 Tax=Gulosibacter sp. TaxID=2817531 RepID=UPI003F92D522
MSQQLQTVSVVDAAANRLRDNLFAGVYEAGEELKDTTVATAFGIARPTARMAVQQLINEGLLVRPPGYSARVREFDVHEIEDIYRMRGLLELEAVRQVHAAGGPMDGIKAALLGFEGLKHDSDWTKINVADLQFHAAVVDAANSPRLSSFFEAIGNETRLLNALLQYQYPQAAGLYQEHEQLFELLVEGVSITELEAAWTHHLDISRDFIVQHVSTKAVPRK